MEPNRTQYDLHFRIFRIPVRVHPFFWLICLFISWGAMSQGIQFVLVAAACVFISILIHELGHVLMGKVFGTNGHIILYGFGGLAVGSNALSHWWKRVLVAFAGPAAGFILLGLVVVAVRVFYPDELITFLDYQRLEMHLMSHEEIQPFITRWFAIPPLRRTMIGTLIFINLLWGIINLFPVFPLDGGQISRDLFTQFLPGRGLRLSLGISLVVAGLIAINSLIAMTTKKPLIPGIPSGLWIGLLFGMLAIQSFMQLQQGQRSDPWDPWQGQGRPWERRDPWR